MLRICRHPLSWPQGTPWIPPCRLESGIPAGHTLVARRWDVAPAETMTMAVIRYVGKWGDGTWLGHWTVVSMT